MTSNTAQDTRFSTDGIKTWSQMALLATGHWLAVELWANVLNYLHGVSLRPELLAGEVLVVLSGAIINLVQWRVIRWASGCSRPALWGTIIASVALCALAYGGALRVAALVTPIIMPAARPTVWATMVWDTIYFSTWFVLWVSIVTILESASAARRRDKQLDAALIAGREAELRALHYQVNPHFLYNTLNAIAALIEDRSHEKAEAMVLNLAEFFRGTLACDPLHDVRLSKEVELQRLYLSIEEVRFGDALMVHVDVPDYLEDALVPALILQPLVENAIKHGMNAQKALVLDIRARSDGDTLTLTVQDDGPGLSDKPGGGVGLENVRSRLATRFGRQAVLSARAMPRRGYIAQIALPLRFRATSRRLAESPSAHAD